MSRRLIVVSNRIPTGDTPSGGLVVALDGALRRHGGLWIGACAGAGPADTPLCDIPGMPYDRLGFTLTEDEQQDYYLGFANSVLWPLLHHRTDLVEIRQRYQDAYHEVNRRLAARIAEVATPEDVIWVHDYHFFPLAKELRAQGLNNRIGFFLHIPFPNLTDLQVLPRPEDFAEWISQYDMVGLQTRADVARCLEMMRADPRAEFLPDGSVKFGARRTVVESHPIGIALDDLDPPEATADDGCAVRGGIVGVDRLDYTKGLPQRLLAYERYLELHGTGERVSLTQIAPPSRESVAAYRSITLELETIAGRVNGRFGELDWTPVIYFHRPVPRAQVMQVLGSARACLVTSLADGMNLVAKEFVAAQNPEDPGVLILSRFAGAAEDMTQALLVNPHDIDEIAEAIHTAIHMPRAERRARHAACLQVVHDTEVSAWAEGCVARLSALTPGAGHVAGHLAGPPGGRSAPDLAPPSPELARVLAEFRG